MVNAPAYRCLVHQTSLMTHRARGKRGRKYPASLLGCAPRVGRLIQSVAGVAGARWRCCSNLPQVCVLVTTQRLPTIHPVSNFTVQAVLLHGSCQCTAAITVCVFQTTPRLQLCGKMQRAHHVLLAEHVVMYLVGYKHGRHGCGGNASVHLTSTQLQILVAIWIRTHSSNCGSGGMACGALMTHLNLIKTPSSSKSHASTSATPNHHSLR